MSSANANSSVSKKTFNEEIQKIKVVMGPFKAVLNDKEYNLEMSPEYAKDFSVEMMELAIPVGDYKKVVDKNGKIKERIDMKTGKKFITNKKDKLIEK